MPEMPQNAEKESEKVLRTIFGLTVFKPFQKEIITMVLQRREHMLAVLPTGAGKSLCYQIPALLQKNITIVICPLIALMKDQIDSLHKRGIESAYFINSTLTDAKRTEILDLARQGKVKMLYIAPESLKSEHILSVLQALIIDLVVIDEAHCISLWGHNFRPDYLRLGGILKILRDPIILCLTATATPEVEKDIQTQLGIRCDIIKASFDRPNLFFETVPLKNGTDKEQYFIHLMKQLHGSTIVFATYQKTTENLVELLTQAGISSTFYHAGLENEEREKCQNAFLGGEYQVIVATIAFGMGIDKADIRNIIHYNIPQSLENYYQEIGRAGRDGKPAQCIALFSKGDVFRLRSLLFDSWPNQESIRSILTMLNKKKGDYSFVSPRSIALECNTHEIPVKLVLHRLEEAGIIKIYPQVPFEAKLVLKKEISEIECTLPEKKQELTNFFRSSFFHNSRKLWFSFEETIQERKCHYFRLLDLIRLLQKMEYIDLIEIKYKDIMLVQEEINHFDSTPIILLFEEILQKNLEKVSQVVRFMEHSGCIRQELLAYFGERGNNQCTACARCKGSLLAIAQIPDLDFIPEKEKKKYSIPYNDKDIPILTFLKAIVKEEQVRYKDFVNILTGTVRKTSARRNFRYPYYGILGVHKEKDKKAILKKLLDWLLSNNYLKKEADDSLRITRKGLGLLQEHIAIT